MEEVGHSRRFAGYLNLWSFGGGCEKVGVVERRSVHRKSFLIWCLIYVGDGQWAGPYNVLLDSGNNVSGIPDCLLSCLYC